MKRHREDGEEGEQPEEGWNNLGTARGPPTGKAKRLHQRHVAVDAHHRQAEDAGELIDAVQHHDSFARHISKNPAVHEILTRYKGKTNHE